MSRLRTIPLLAFTFGVAACGGEPATDEEGLGTDNGQQGPCEETRTSLGLLEQAGAGLGFSATEVLAFAEKDHQSVLRWLPMERVSYRPEAGDVPVSVSVDYAGGPIELVESFLKYPPDFIDVGPGLYEDSCINALSIEVEVELTTAAGALAERFTADLRARSALSAEIVHPVELDAMGGSFEIIQFHDLDLPDTTGTEVRQPMFRISFSELGTDGRFEALLLQFWGGGAVAGAFLELARWPAGDPEQATVSAEAVSVW